MRYLIDTHVLIWYLDGDDRLPQRLKEELNNENNTVIVSVVSLFEIAIKLTKIDKVKFKVTLPQIEAHLLEMDFLLIGIHFNHLHTLITLPTQHGDPFDRLLIAQAIAENLTLVSVDRQFKNYSVNLLS